MIVQTQSGRLLDWVTRSDLSEYLIELLQRPVDVRGLDAGRGEHGMDALELTIR